MPALSDYWQQTALDLINSRHVEYDDPAALGTWIGRATATLAEALRVAGNTDGIDAIIGQRGGTESSASVAAPMPDPTCHICGRQWHEQSPEVRFIYAEGVWECFEEGACLERAALERML